MPELTSGKGFVLRAGSKSVLLAEGGSHTLWHSLRIAQPGHGAASISAGGGIAYVNRNCSPVGSGFHWHCLSPLRSASRMMPLVLHRGWEGKSGAAAFLSFKGAEAKAQKGQRACSDFWKAWEGLLEPGVSEPSSYPELLSPGGQTCDSLCVCSLSCVRLFATPRAVACQAPLSMGFPRVGCHFLLQGIVLTQALNPRLLHLLHYRWILFYWATWEAIRKSQLPVTNWGTLTSPN